MTNSQRTSLAIIALCVLGAGALFWWQSAPKPAAKPAAPSQKAPPKPVAKNGAVRIPSDKNWSEASEEELREFTALFGSRTMPTSLKMNVAVESGETLLTDAYEARPGEFVFSKLTPTRKQLPDGTSVIEMQLSCFSISLTGEPRDIMSRTWDLEPLNIYTTGVFTDHGMYHVTASARSGYTEGPINLQVSGDFREHSPKMREALEKQKAERAKSAGSGANPPDA